MPKRIETEASCPMDAILRVLMGSWTTYLLWLLQTGGPSRFGALRRAMPGISPKVLTERLRHLEAHGLIHRDYQPSIPPQVTYSLTARGEALKSVLADLHALAIAWRAEDGARSGDAGLTAAPMPSGGD